MKCSGKNCPMQHPYDVKACVFLEHCPYATLIPCTNADRIRAMSDEELAKYLSNPCDCAVDPERDGYRECGTGQCENRTLPPSMRGEGCAWWDLFRRYGEEKNDDKS